MSPVSVVVPCPHLDKYFGGEVNLFSAPLLDTSIEGGFRTTVVRTESLLLSYQLSGLATGPARSSKLIAYRLAKALGTDNSALRTFPVVEIMQDADLSPRLWVDCPELVRRLHASGAVHLPISLKSALPPDATEKMLGIEPGATLPIKAVTHNRTTLRDFVLYADEQMGNETSTTPSEPRKVTWKNAAAVQSIADQAIAMGVVHLPVTMRLAPADLLRAVRLRDLTVFKPAPAEISLDLADRFLQLLGRFERRTAAYAEGLVPSDNYSTLADCLGKLGQKVHYDNTAMGHVSEAYPGADAYFGKITAALSAAGRHASDIVWGPVFNPTLTAATLGPNARRILDPLRLQR